MTRTILAALAVLVGLAAPALASIAQSLPAGAQNVENDPYPGQDDPNPLRPPEDWGSDD